MSRTILAVLVAGSLAWPTLLHAQRKPLSVEALTFISHRPTEPRLRYDSIQDAFTRYDLEGRIEFLSATGDFLLSWNGRDGNRKSMTWVPPNKHAAIVAAEVTYDEGTGLYSYSYAVTNLNSSHQRLAMLFIEAQMIQEAEKPDETWEGRALSPFLKSELGVEDGWGWNQPHGLRGIPPGETETGFRLLSPLPPAVTSCYTMGRTPNLVSTGEEMPEELHEAIDHVYYRLPVGSTLGPAPGQPPDTPAEEVNRLLADLDKAGEQGWLGPPPSVSQIRSSMSGIGSALEAGDRPSAAERASALMALAASERIEGLLSEGRALLELRLRFLRDRLRERD